MTSVGPQSHAGDLPRVEVDLPTLCLRVPDLAGLKTGATDRYEVEMVHSGCWLVVFDPVEVRFVPCGRSESEPP